MLNGRCKVWRDEGGNYHAELALDAPKGIIKMKRTAALTDSVSGWDPRAPETGPGTLIKKKVEYIAGFFPVEEVVGKKAHDTAQKLLAMRADDATAMKAMKHINTIKAAAARGDDDAFDIDYALRRIVKGAQRTQVGSAYYRGVLAGEPETTDTFDAGPSALRTEIGFKPFKKLAKWAKKNPIKAVASAVLPPVAAYNLITAAKKRKPAAVQQVATIRRWSEGMPAYPAAPPPSPEETQKAQAALDNLRAADAFQAEGVVPPPSYSRETPFEASYDDAYVPSEGEYYGESDTVGSIFSNLKKAVGGAISKLDPTRPGSFTAPLLSNLPIVGPGVKASLDLLDQAKKLNPSAIEKIKTVKSLAEAGVPKAQAAKANLLTAQELSKAAEKLAAEGASTGKTSKVGKKWFPFIDFYHRGLAISR